MKGGCGNVAGHGHVARAAYVNGKARRTRCIALMVVTVTERRSVLGSKILLGDSFRVFSG